MWSLPRDGREREGNVRSLKDNCGEDTAQQWEQRLKSEGLAPLETTYRRTTGAGVRKYTKIEPSRRAEFSDYFTRCEEFVEQLKVRLKIWQLYSGGSSFLAISRATGKPLGTVINRIRKTRREMVFYFASRREKVPVQARSCADILEVFVEAEQLKRKG